MSQIVQPLRVGLQRARQDASDAITVLLTGHPDDRDTSTLRHRLTDLLQSRGAGCEAPLIFSLPA